MMRIVEGVQLLILTVNRQGILSQIIGSNTEKVYFFGKIIGNHDCCRGFNHHTHFHILIGDALFGELFFHIGDDFLCFLYFPKRGNHRQHNGDISKGTGT